MNVVRPCEAKTNRIPGRFLIGSIARRIYMAFKRGRCFLLVSNFTEYIRDFYVDKAAVNFELFAFIV